MPSRTIRPTEAPADAPFAYTIGTTEGLAAESVFAQWDGSGASGDFLPCVSYYNAEGVLLDRAFPDGVTLHAGDTAEVSYRPFRRGGAAAASAVTGMEVLSTPLVGITVPPHTVTKLAFGHHSGPVWLDNFPSNTNPTVIHAGTYAFSLVAELMAPQPVNTDLWWATLSVADTLTTTAAWPGSFGATAFTGRIVGLPLTRECAAGAVVNVIVFHNQAVNCFIRGYGVVERLG